MPIKVHRDEQPSLNMTPMIDIVFLLIIFFMVGTKFTELSEAEKEIPLQVPEVEQVEALTAAPKKRIINVYEDGNITLDGQSVSLVQLQNELTAARLQYQQLGVIVRGDGKSLHQNVTEVLAACRRAEITDLGISVRVAQLNE
jgi:biopolymer transport protein ExbD